MALYLLALDAGPVLVRARNGRRAAELAGGCSDTAIHRICEDGPEGIVDPEAAPAAPPAPATAVRKAYDVTELADPPGTRRFLDPRTGRTTTEHTPSPEEGA